VQSKGRDGERGKCIMSEPFLGQITIFGFNFAPYGWAECDGQLLPINQNQSLYSLLGTTYGGDGRTTFGLPDLRGRMAIHMQSSQYALGAKSGIEAVVLTDATMPAHQHQASDGTGPRATNDAAAGDDPTNNLLGQAGGNVYGDYTTGAAMNSGSLSTTGGGQGHENMSPFQVLNYCIALRGLFPSRN
jgi:microcystin-dependent protein